MKFVVTGGAGFIGSHLVDHLIKLDHKVVVIDNFATGREENLKESLGKENLKVVDQDIVTIKKNCKEFKRADYVVHLAALADIVPSIEDPKKYYDTNVTGTLNVLECARENDVKKFIYAASGSCYGIPSITPTNENVKCDPKYPYALTKYLGEQTVMHWNTVYKIPAISLRFFNVFGPRSRTTGSYGAVFGVFLAQKANKKPYTVVGNGYQSRDFIFVDDVVNAICLACFSDVKRDIFNVGSGNNYTIQSLITLLGGNKITYLPDRPGEPKITQACITKIQNKLKWNPTIDFRTGVKIMVEHTEDWKEAPIWDADKIQEATNSWFKHLG